MAMRRPFEEPTGGPPEERPSKAQPEDPSADSSVRVSMDSSVRAQALFRRRGPDLTALAMAAQTGDPQAMRAFLLAAAPTVRGVCRSVLGSGHAELDDTIQECLIEIMRALPQYRAEGPALNYIKQVVLHRAMAARKRGRNRERQLRTFVEESSVHTFDVHAESLPSLHAVRDVVDDLPAAQAEAILMRSVLGFSLEEIALATRVSINTAKSRLRVAKESLRRQLEQELPSAEVTE